jgi:hypothetical protein
MDVIEVRLAGEAVQSRLSGQAADRAWEHASLERFLLSAALQHSTAYKYKLWLEVSSSSSLNRCARIEGACRLSLSPGGPYHQIVPTHFSREKKLFKNGCYNFIAQIMYTPQTQIYLYFIKNKKQKNNKNTPR